MFRAVGVMNGWLPWVWGVAGVVGVAVGCGDTTRQDSGWTGTPRASAPADGRIAATVQLDGGRAGAGAGGNTLDGDDEERDFEICPYGEEILDTLCYFQVVDAGVLAAGGAGGAAAKPCHIPIEPKPVPDYYRIFVYVDCQLIAQMQFPREGDSPEFWQFDDPNAPAAIVLSEPLCLRLREDGFERVDVLYGCNVFRIF
jgi:hypothetical protein